MSKKSSTTKKSTSSPTVSYNPKTGAKLKTGESVTINGKTYTQGSTNIGGTSTPSSSSRGSSNKPKVGIIKTAPATGSGYSTAPARTNGMSVAPKPASVQSDAIRTSAPKKTSRFGNPFTGGFFKNVAQGASTAFSGAKNAVNTFGNAATAAIKKGGLQANASDSFAQAVSQPTIESKTVAPLNPAFDYSGNDMNIAKIQSSSQYQREQTGLMRSQDAQQKIANDFVSSQGQTPSTPVMNSGGSGSLSTRSAGKGGAQTTALDTPVTTEKTTMTNPDGSVTQRSTVSSASPTTSYNPNTVAGAANAISVLTENINNSKNDPYNKYNQKGDMIKYTDTALTNLASLYSDPNTALSDYQSNPQFKAQIDALTKLTGKTINDVAALIKPVTNGITGPQTTAQYLAANNTPITGVDAGTKEILTEEQKYNAQRVAMMNQELETQKSEAKTLIEFYEKQEMRREISEREKAQFAIDKAKAEFDAADAETEQQRIMATENLKNFLAKIGALSTDGAAGVGIANLEQKYQAQRAALRSNFQLAKRQIEINMNDNLNALEEARDEKVFKLNQDLSKTEREISLDVMRLNHELNKDILKAKLAYTKEIKAEQKKAREKSSAFLKSWESAFFDTAATADYFNSLPAEFKASWKGNNRMPTDGTRTTLSGDKGLVQDFSSFEKKRASEFKITDSKAFELQQQGVDVEAYKTDPEYRTYVNSQLQ